MARFRVCAAVMLGIILLSVPAVTVWADRNENQPNRNQQVTPQPTNTPVPTTPPADITVPSATATVAPALPTDTPTPVPADTGATSVQQSVSVPTPTPQQSSGSWFPWFPQQPKETPKPASVTPATRRVTVSPTPTPPTDAGVKDAFHTRLSSLTALAVKQRMLYRDQLKQQMTGMPAASRTKGDQILIKLEQIQSSRVSRMAQITDRLGEILDSTQRWSGVDMAKVQAARAKIAAAREAILTVAPKAYGVKITGKQNLRKDFTATAGALEADLKSAWDAVMAARSAVYDVVSGAKPR